MIKYFGYKSIGATQRRLITSSQNWNITIHMHEGTQSIETEKGIRNAFKLVGCFTTTPNTKSYATAPTPTTTQIA